MIGKPEQPNYDPHLCVEFRNTLYETGVALMVGSPLTSEQVELVPYLEQPVTPSSLARIIKNQSDDVLDLIDATLSSL